MKKILCNISGYIVLLHTIAQITISYLLGVINAKLHVRRKLEGAFPAVMRLASVIVAVSLTIACYAQAQRAPSANRALEPAVDWKAFLSEQDPVWDTLTPYFYDGPMTGNGLIGTLMHKMDKKRFDGDTNKILFEINRTDLVDSCARRF